MKMIVRNLKDVDSFDVTAHGTTGTKIQWLINKEHGAPRFAMRLFTLEPDAQIGIHGHPEEHEIYVIQGEMNLIAENGTKTHVKATDAIYMPPDEKHGYEVIGSETVKFICVIPILEK